MCHAFVLVSTKLRKSLENLQKFNCRIFLKVSTDLVILGNSPENFACYALLVSGNVLKKVWKSLENPSEVVGIIFLKVSTILVILGNSSEKSWMPQVTCVKKVTTEFRKNLKNLQKL